MKKITKEVKSVVSVLFLISTMFFLLPTTGDVVSPVQINTTTPYTMSITTDAIVHVDGNWSETAAIYDWCTGSGTYDDPYTIKNLVIDADGDEYGVLIKNTWEYFRIENCTIFNSGSIGIALYYVENGAVIRNTVYNTYSLYGPGGGIGILIRYSSNIIISGNDITDNDQMGISVGSSSNYNTISGNNCTGNQYGIHIFSAYNNIIGNNCTDNDSHGIILSSNYNTISGNKGTGNSAGIYVHDSSYNTISENNFIDNYCGIALSSWSTFNNITENNCTGNSYDGIYAFRSSYNTISGNNCTKNSGYGIYLYDNSHYNEVYNNSLIKNTNGHLKDLGEDNNIYNNTYILILVAFFETNTTVIAVGQSVEFIDTTIGGSMPLVYQWSFGDGSANSTVQNQTHRYIALGEYTVALTVTDADGDVSVAHTTIFVKDTIVPTLIAPLDITYEQGTVNHNINWTATDINPDIYIIYKDNVEIASDNWDSNSPITISVDGLAPGEYNYTIVVYDEFSNSVQDTVIVTVQDTTNPILNSPADISYEELTTGHNISWTSTDNNSGTYIIYKDNVEIVSDTWLSGVAITISVDGLAIGSYNYTVVIWDVFNNSARDTVIVLVQDAATPSPEDTTAPVLTSSQDINYEENTTGHYISWNITDINNPGIYIVYKNNIKIENGTWSLGIPITINVDGLIPGEYNYIIIAWDACGNSAADTVIVTVNTNNPNNNSENPVSIDAASPLFVLFLVIVTIVVIVVKRKR